MREAETLSAALAAGNNRTLVCNGSHVMHLGKNGPDLRGLERTLRLSSEVRHFCGESLEAIASEAGAVEERGFLDEDFGFRRLLEDNWRDVLDEWLAIPSSRSVAWPESGAVAAGQWRMLPLWVAERPVPEILDVCPKTAALLERVPNLYAASFSILGPGSMLPEHRGDVTFVYRSHLALRVPQPSAMKVGRDVRTWEEGKTMAFDDTLDHFSWNFGSHEKVVLMVDFVRPDRVGARSPEERLQLERDRAHYSGLFPEFAGAILSDRTDVAFG